jgi:hypothetical protein
MAKDMAKTVHSMAKVVNTMAKDVDTDMAKNDVHWPSLCAGP